MTKQHRVVHPVLCGVAAALAMVGLFSVAPVAAQTVKKTAAPKVSAKATATKAAAPAPVVAAASPTPVRTAGTVVARVVALDQSIVYNRFGSFNPYGMVYALARDVVDLDTGKTLDQPGASAKPCRVALRSDKRPRPLVLRGNVGDKLVIEFTNLLCDSAIGTPGNDPFAEVEVPDVALEVPEVPEVGGVVEAGGVAEVGGVGGGGGAAVGPQVDPVTGLPIERPNGFSRPATRLASMMFNGLTHDASADTWDPRVTGISGIAPGQSITYRLVLEREGGHVFHDNAAPAGGEGDGGSTVLGLYGSVNVEPAGSNVYRSEVRKEIWAAAKVGAQVSYEAVDTTGALTGKVGTPLLNMHQNIGAQTWEVVHTDLNAVVQDYKVVSDAYEPTNEGWFREFTTLFQDELKTVQAYADQIDPTGAGAGLRDGFAINYGASGVGSLVAANRLGVGPAATCKECALEEFFLTSWANGDPAMVVKYDANGAPQQQYPDDPGNVHHSYLGDPVKFRAMQAGVKETHVFHLHANQWFGKNGSDKSTYLDSQTLSPRQAMNFEIAYTGSNRNLSVGDAIFHCHMYPHFAQGMWALWRIHDVFEDGGRRLPDGELGRGTDPLTGVTAGGAFSPALVPIRGAAMAPAPTYGAAATPGFPFFMPGQAGRRPPQPPLDLAEGSDYAGSAGSGIGRHIVLQGDRELGAGVAAADMSSRLTSAELKLLPLEGTQLERAAMGFHATAGGFASKTPAGAAATFKVNGLPEQPGAPFADPCPATAPLREYDVSVIQLDLVVNKAGWHDPQARINVLSSEVGEYEGRTRAANPFFFRAHSGDCIVFKHTNRVPAVLEKDDFQVKTPTDTIGQHIHLVKFDVTASDGGGNGWNYEDGTFAREALVERVEAAHQFGSFQREYSDGTVETLAASELPYPDTIGYQTTIQRWWADELYDKAGKDRTLRTVFTHDHFGASSIQQHGFYNALVVEPKGSTWLAADGTPLTTGVGPEAIITDAADAKTHPDYREFLLASADFSLLYTQDGRPVDPPAKPEAISTHHHNPYVVNYKNEPIPLRLSATGDAATLHADQKSDPAFAFSSKVHGDPFTPVLKAFEGERVQIRLIHGSQEVQQVFTMHGHRWLREPSDPASAWVGAQEIGLSEHFEINTGKLAKVTAAEGQRDYLFHYGTTDALWNGAWGILRAYDKVDAVDPVSKRPVRNFMRPMAKAAAATGTPLASWIESRLANTSCPVNSALRNYDVEVWAARDLLPGGELVYNQRAGITDPTALMYVHKADVAPLRSGAKQPEPFVMRANAGDCITVNLTNMLPKDQPVPDLPGDAQMPMTVSLNADQVKPSKYVGMHAGVLSFDPRTSDGANVGYNPEQLAAPYDPAAPAGHNKRSYTWYAGRIKAEDAVLGSLDIGQPIEYGTVALRAMSDVVKQGAQGLVGALIVEPKGSTWWDATNTRRLNPGSTDSTATIRSGAKTYKEFVLHYQDGLNLRKNGAQILQHWVGDDSYDMGERALNYRTEPLWSRIDYNSQVGASAQACTEALVIAGDINPCVLPANLMVDDDAQLPADLRGQPVETPVFEARAGEAVKFRVLQADGRARQHSFRVIGHSYADQGLEKFVATGASLIAPGKAVTADLYGGAKKGYWHYRDGPNMFVNTGVWGLFKVR